MMHGVRSNTGIVEVWESGTDGLPTFLAVKILKDYSLVFPGDTMEMEKCHRKLWGAVRVIGPFPCPLILASHGTTAPQRPSPPSQLRPPLPRYAAGDRPPQAGGDNVILATERIGLLCSASENVLKSKDCFKGPVTSQKPKC